MRPAEITKEQIIAAGQQLTEQGRKVNGFALRQVIGAGSPARMFQVWSEQSQTGDSQQSPKMTELPIEIEATLSELGATLLAQMKSLAASIHATSVKIAERRVADVTANFEKMATQHADEMADAARVIEQMEIASDESDARLSSLEAKLSEAQEKINNLSAENGRLRERDEKLSSGMDNPETAAAIAVVQERLLVESGLRQKAEEECQRLNIVLAAITDQMNELKHQNAMLQKDKDFTERRIGDLTQRGEELRLEVHRLGTANQGLTSALSLLQK